MPRRSWSTHWTAVEIRAYFQPIVDMRTGDVVAIEALARWQTDGGIREP